MIRAALALGGSGAVTYTLYSHFLDENPLTNKRRFILWGPNFDVRLGRLVSKSQKNHFLKANKVVGQDQALHKLAYGICTELLAHLPPCAPRDWNVTVVRDSSPNAFAVPDGSIFLTTGLIYLADCPDELALVLAHEVGHVYLRHSAHQMSTMLSVSILASLVQYLVFGETYKIVDDVQKLFLSLPMSREHEYEADRFGCKMTTDTGFDNNKGPRILGKLRKLEGQVVPWVSTHPPTEERVKELRLEVMKLKDLTVPEDAQMKRKKLRYLDKLMTGARGELTKAVTA